MSAIGTELKIREAGVSVSSGRQSGPQPGGFIAAREASPSHHLAGQLFGQPAETLLNIRILCYCTV